MLQFPPSTVLKLRQRYVVHEFLGEGNSGGVWKIQNGEGLWFTIKIFYKIPFSDASACKNFLERIGIVQKIEHDHILAGQEHGVIDVQAYSPDSMLVGPIPYIVAQYAEHTLAQLQKNSEDPFAKEIDEWQRMELALQISLGLRKIHSYFIQNTETNRAEPFFHANLRPSNILIFTKGHRKNAKIADLGWNSLTLDFPEICPEQKQGKNMDFRADLFSLGYLVEHILLQEHSQVNSLLKDLQNENPKERPDLGKLIVALWNERRRMYNDQLAYTVYLLGVNLYQKGHFDYALKDFQKAVALNPSLVSAWIYQGNAQRELNQHTQAMESYNQAISLDANNALAYENRAELYGEQNSFDQAIQDFEKAIELDPSAVSAIGSLGIVYTQLQNWEKALFQFNRLLEQQTDFANAYVDRADVLAELSRYEEALQDYRKAVELQCDDPNLSSKIAEIENKIGTPDG